MHACRFVVLMAEQHDYFFILYIISFAAEGWLAVLALFHYPSEDNMEPIPDDPNNPVIYQASLLLMVQTMNVTTAVVD